MPITTVSGRSFNQNISRARRAAMEGPVIITDRGKPAQVLISFEAYQHLTGEKASLADALTQPEGAADIPFDPPRMGALFRVAQLG